jgi:hypothetical protein
MIAGITLQEDSDVSSLHAVEHGSSSVYSRYVEIMFVCTAWV